MLKGVEGGGLRDGIDGWSGGGVGEDGQGGIVFWGLWVVGVEVAVGLGDLRPSRTVQGGRGWLSAVMTHQTVQGGRGWLNLINSRKSNLVRIG